MRLAQRGATARQDPDRRAPRQGTREHILCETAEPEFPHGHASVHAAELESSPPQRDGIVKRDKKILGDSDYPQRFHIRFSSSPIRSGGGLGLIGNLILT
jgi:hypothetical protein